MLKKFYAALAMILVLIMLVMTGCGTNTGKQGDATPTPSNDTSNGNTGGNETSEPVDEKDPADITGNVEYAIYSWGVAFAEEMAKKFNEVYPNINVTITSFEGDLTPYLTTQAASGALPDVVYGWENLTYPISQGWVHPLDEFLANDPETEYIAKGLLDSYKFGDKTYAVPVNLQFNTILVNLDLIDQLNMDPPAYDWTIDEFKEYLTKATTDTYSGINHLWDFDGTITGVISPTLHQRAYDPSDGKFKFTDQAYIDAITLQKELKAVPGLVSDDLKNDELRNQGLEDDYQKKFGKDADALREGKVLMGFHGTWDLSWIKTMNYRFDMYPLPQNPEVGFRQAVHADHAFMLSTAENPEAAYEWLKWISFGEQGLLARMEYYKNQTDEEGNPNPDFIIPPSTQRSVVEFFDSLDFVPGGIKYIYNHMDNTFRGDYYKIVPGFDAVFYDVIFPKQEDIRAGKVEASAVVGEMEQLANEALQAHWDEFNSLLEKLEQ